jgi:hypothetical protein
MLRFSHKFPLIVFVFPMVPRTNSCYACLSYLGIPVASGRFSTDAVGVPTTAHTAAAGKSLPADAAPRARRLLAAAARPCGPPSRPQCSNLRGSGAWSSWNPDTASSGVAHSEWWSVEKHAMEPGTAPLFEFSRRYSAHSQPVAEPGRQRQVGFGPGSTSSTRSQARTAHPQD